MFVDLGEYGTCALLQRILIEKRTGKFAPIAGGSSKERGAESDR
jgi:hypothetical protein